MTLGTKLYFTASTGTYNQLYQTDGTSNGTVVVAGYDANNGLLVNSPVVLNGQVYFIVQRTSRQNQGTTILLYKTTSTTAVLVDTLVNNNVPPSTAPVSVINFRVLNNQLYYYVKSESFNESNTYLVVHTAQIGGKKVLGLIASNRTSSGTTASTVSNVFIGTDYVYLFGNSTSNSSGFVTNGKTIGIINTNEVTPTTRIVSPYTVSYSNSAPPPVVANYRGLGVLGNVCYFTRNDTLFNLDIRGVAMIVRVGVGQPNVVQKVGNFLYFTNSNNQLWRVGGPFGDAAQINTALSAGEVLGTIATDGTELYATTTLSGNIPTLRRLVDNTFLSGSNGVTGQAATISYPFFANGNAYVVTADANASCVQGLIEFNPRTLISTIAYFPILTQATCNDNLLLGLNAAVTSDRNLYFDLRAPATGNELYKIDLNAPPPTPLPDFSVRLNSVALITLGVNIPRDPLAVTFRVSSTLLGTNINPNDARTFRLRAYISTDSILSPDDIVNTRQDWNQQLYSNGFTQEFVLPYIPRVTGTNYILFKIDADGEIAESNENNNVSNALPLNNVYALSCLSSSNEPWNEWISRVQFNTINSVSEKVRYGVPNVTPGYSNFLDISTTLNRGQTYPLTVTPSLSYPTNPANLFTRAWIDYNQNGVFEPSELVLERNNVNQPANQSVVVPATALLGTTAMRVSTKVGAYPTACEVFTRGEVEDYTIVITQSSGLPDLTLDNIVFRTPSVAVGQTLNYDFDLKNLGTGNVSTNASTVIQQYLSRDRILDASDVAMGLLTTVNLPSERTLFAANGGFTVTGIAAGNYYLILKVDPNNTIAESNENNNVLVSPTTISITANNCANDVTPPVFANCPTNQLRTGASLGCTSISWRVPTATDNCSTPSISFVLKRNSTILSQTDTVVFVQLCPDNYTDTVIYTARDARGNVATCQFEIKAIDRCISDRRDEGSLPTDQNLTTTNGNCVNFKWTVPVRFFPCPRFYSYEPWALPTTSPSVAIGRADLRVVNGAPSGSVVLDSACFPIGTTLVNYVDLNGVAKTFKVTVTRANTAGADITVNIAANPTTFSKYSPLALTVMASNFSSQRFTNVVIKLPFPTGTVNNGNATITNNNSATTNLGSWNEWCAGGVQCFEWRIPTLEPNSAATLTLPLYVLNPVSPIVATATLVSSTPVDGNAANNVARVSINAAAPTTQGAVRATATQQVPLVISALYPSPTEDVITLELQSLKADLVRFEFFNLDGKLIRADERAVQKGFNKIPFEVQDFPSGMYFLQTNVGVGRGTPIRFVKM